MKKFYYLFICIPFLTLLFSYSVNAAVSRVTVSFNTTSAGTFTIGTQTYTSVMPTQVDFEDTTPNEYHGVYELTHNIDLALTSTNKYLSGSFVIQIITTIGSGEGTISAGTLNFQPVQDDGLHVYLYEYSPTQYRLAVIMDNYSPKSGFISLGTITTTYNVVATNPNDASLSRNFTTSISKTSGGSIEAYDAPINDRFTALLWSAINQATGPDLASIINMLTDIRNQDYTYYVIIVNKLSEMSQGISDANSKLLTILNDMNTDFQSIQTVLDLFPSYRTQVLAYWQQLLEMNAAQSSEAAELESQYQDKGSQSADLNEGLGSLNLPEVDADDFNILGNVDSSAKTNFFGLIGLITNNSLITTILIIIVTGAIVGYALYGKK